MVNAGGVKLADTYLPNGVAGRPKSMYATHIVG
jgi:hypothetical protein